MPRGKNNNGEPNAGWFKRGNSRPKSAEHRRAIGEAQRLAWQSKRKRKPIGSKCVDSDGYVRVKVVAGSGRWKGEHLLVMEQHIGRLVTKPEEVHHINGDRQDKRIENLFLCENKSRHHSIEWSAKRAMKKAIERGYVRFDKSTGEYVVC